MQSDNFIVRFLVEALKAGVKILLFYVMFQLSLMSYSLLYDWKTDFQTGIFWTGYYYFYSILVVFIGVINILLKPKHSSQLYINLIGLVFLLYLTINSFEYIPYKATLPSLITAIILLGEPIVCKLSLKKLNKK